jgi:indolepyruvate ferredoxin oxidoreductase beta subunit
VHSMVRFGHVVHSPLIPRREADIIVSLEAMEGARWLAYLKPGGIILASTEQRPPLRVLTGEEEYPKNLDSVYRSVGELYWVDALAIAREAGSARAANTVMLGALSIFLDFSEEEWVSAISSRFKPAVAELNRAAFLGGRSSVSPRPRD